jgi:peptide/nickel transport system substrate-binding protein
MRPIHSLLAVLMGSLLLAGCTAPAGTRGGEAAVDAPRQVKRLAIGFQGNVVSMEGRARGSGPSIGHEELQEMVNVGLATRAANGGLEARLAESVPTLENGGWKLLPDGRMELTWKLRPNSLWHDGQPVTSADFLFTSRLDQDRELPRAVPAAYESLESVETPDATTVVTLWKQTYIDADKLFMSPVPRHLVEEPYTRDPQNVFAAPYWTTDYIGTGPYKLRDFVGGSHLTLTANDAFVLGRPKIDEVEIRMIPDSNTMVANLLSGTINMTLGHSLSIEQALEVKKLSSGGEVEMGPGNWVALHPQFLNPNPPVMLSLNFRKALLHALDRQQMVDTLGFGLTSVAHTILDPGQPQYREIEERVTKYEFDPRKATQMIETLGYARGADGIFRDPAGERLSVEIRTTTQYDVQRGAMAVTADFWKNVGVASETVMIPDAQQRDTAYRATFPTFELLNGPPSDVTGAMGYRSNRARTEANRFGGGNYPRYQNPEYDAIIDRYFRTIPIAERIQVIGQAVHHLVDNVVELGLFYAKQPYVMDKRLINAAVPADRTATEAWNSHAWELR